MNLDEKIEVIALKNNEVVSKKQMTRKEWNNLTKKHGYIYRAYQIGFSQYK